MQTLLRHITHLLLKDNFVSVEGIGAFRLVRRSASLSANGVFSAPVQTVIFDADACCDNSALITSVVKAEKVESSVATHIVSSGISELKSELIRGGKVSISIYGILQRVEGRFEFVEDVAENWLPPLELTPIAVRKTTEEAVDAAKDALANRREALTRSLQRTASSAAAIAVFALVAFIIAQLPTRQAPTAQVASMGIETISATSVEEPLIETPGVAEPHLVLVLNTPVDGTAPAKVRRQPVKTVEQSGPARYCLIVASLATEAECNKYLMAHSTTDMPLNVLEKDGRWRVYALSAPAVDELNAAARNLGVYDRYPSAWICRR